ncbi:MAG: glycolate oxidase subunit GlcF, partial [Gammaproteobacteria bacterium]|nr:glycolate oxidase subunit GlcF [Gammaproteobacteria bacterium]
RVHSPAAAPAAAPIVPAARAAGDEPRLRRVLLPAGCVQPGLLPNIDRATRRVLAAAGIETHLTPRSGCCGALRAHLADPDGARADRRRNVDLWWPLLERGEIDAIVVNASACGAAIKEYGHALRDDPAYAAKAARVAAATRDLGELLPDLVPRLRPLVREPGARPIAYHAPCTLQHGQRLVGGVEAALRTLGFDLRPPSADANLCCGSAGTYSVLQPAIARELRDRKLRSLIETGSACIVSANVGCILHLQSGGAVPVRHWIELVDEAIGGFHVSHRPGA